MDDFISRWKEYRCTWMEKPDSWRWAAPGNMVQGFGLNWRQSPGMANLLWLATDLDKPPTMYDARANEMYMLLLISGPHTRLNDIELLDQAGSLTLRQFRNELISGTLSGPLQLVKHKPVINLLAMRRLHDAVA